MDFCAKMCGQLLLEKMKKNSEENLVLSPLSFHAILHMTATGASGKTLKQMRKFLECKNNNEVHSKFSDIMSIASGGNDNGGDPLICCLNGAWADQRFPLKPYYKDVVENLFKSQAKNVNMSKPEEVVEEINEWAKSATNGLITEVLKVKHIKPLTRLILGNALYFKGFWEDPFNRESTMDKDFYLLNGETVSVPFMTGCYKYYSGSFDDFDLVKIPYRAGENYLDGKSFSFYIFLPKERDGLQDVLQKAVTDMGFFGQGFKELEYRCYDIFWIPKFKITYETEDGREKMIKMGLNLPFDEDEAELTEIFDNRDLYVSMVIQKSFIEIDEEGTEAVAVTLESDDDMGFSLDYSPPPPTRFVADHPFLFMVREDKSGSVLFTGVVLNPLLKDD